MDKFLVDSGSAIYAVTFSMQNPDFVLQNLILTISRAFTTVAPGIKTRAGDVEELTHAAYIVCLPVIKNEFKFHF
jgi:hypothetical protein